jgi:flagellar biosynthesis protein FlhF
VLVEGRRAVVWRLDGRTANTAEALSVYGEILGTTVERSIPANSPPPDADLLFVDLPGINAQDPVARDHLAQQLQELGNAQVHLVLNAAYEMPLLLSQARAFAALPITDLILTHLDEETNWGKLWNLVLGTNFSIRFLSSGQNIPGEWTQATPDQVLARQFPSK